MSAPGQSHAPALPREGEARAPPVGPGEDRGRRARGQPTNSVNALRQEVADAHRAWRITALLRLSVASSDRTVVFG